MSDFVDLELARLYHGHLGPNLVIGLKLGNFAIRRLKARKYFGISAEVRCPEKPPISCIIDGIQLSSGCTMGKANIRHITQDAEVGVTFVNTETNESISLRVLPEAIERSLAWFREAGEDEASNRTWALPDSEVFEVIPG